MNRQFSTGANRNSEEGKLDFEGFISPLVIQRFGEYMHKHRHLAAKLQSIVRRLKVSMPFVTH